MKQQPRPAALMFALLYFLCGTVQAQLRVDRNLSITNPTPVPLNATSTATATSTNTAGAPTNKSHASGSYTSTAMGPTIVAKNAEYASTFKISSNVPTGSTISKVWWRYGLSDKPVGFEAVLCWREQQPCWNLTNDNIGSTSAFNGKDASQPFTLHYHVKGSGPNNTPAQGQLNQLIVSFDLP